MKTFLHAFAAIAGLASVAQASDTTIKYEVSTDGLSWSSSLDVAPGTQIQVRARVVWSGATPVYGLGQVIFQPIVSSWTLADHLNTTSGTPFNPSNPENPNPFESGGIGPLGGALTIPSGSVPDSPGVWGRVAPYGSVALGTSNYLRGFLGSGTAAGLLRIAQARATNWIGVGPTSGPSGANNWNGGAGVNTGQAPPALISSDPRYPAFQTGSDVVVFKFGFTLGSSTDARTLTIDTPEEGLLREGGVGAPPSQYGHLMSSWYLGATDNTTTHFFDSTGTEHASVNVVFPTPGTMMVPGVFALMCFRRR